MLPCCTFLPAAPVVLLLLLPFPIIPLETPGAFEEVVRVLEAFGNLVVPVVPGCTVTMVVSASVVSPPVVLEPDVEDEGDVTPELGEDGALDPPVEPFVLLLPLLLLEPLPLPLPLPSPPDTIRPVPQGIADPSGCVCSGAGT